MTVEAGPQPNEGYVETLMADAMNWLNVVGRYEHEIPKPDTPYNRANGEVLRYLGDRMSEGNFDTAEQLAALERQAQQASSSYEYVSDAEFQNTVRTNSFYTLACSMNRFAGRPYNNLST